MLSFWQLTKQKEIKGPDCEWLGYLGGFQRMLKEYCKQNWEIPTDLPLGRHQ